MSKDATKKCKLKTVSDLSKVASKLTFGGPAGVRGPAALPRRHVPAAPRPDVLGGREAGAGGPITVKALEDGDIDVGLLFTGSSVIPKDPEGPARPALTTVSDVRRAPRPTR